MKNLILVALLISMISTMQFEIGAYNSTQKTWRGYNPICDHQCLSNNGNICGVNVRNCCTIGQCVNQFGFSVCQQLLNGFDCDLQSQYQKLNNFLANNGINI